MYNGIKLFADGADYDDIIRLNEDDRIDGFTTNPTLLRKAGVNDYENFAKSVLKKIKDKPISFEVFDDSLDGMINQALYISKWGDNVYVKIPITNTKGIGTRDIIKYLSEQGVKINVTAIMTAKQGEEILSSMSKSTRGIISIFAGRIADTLIDPLQTIQRLSSYYHAQKCENVNLLWASTREILNIKQARDAGADIITVSPNILKKMDLIGKNLDLYSLETVQMFYNDAKEAGYTLNNG